MEIKKWEDGELFEANGGHMYWVFWPGNESNGVTLHYTYLLPVNHLIYITTITPRILLLL